ncbi:MAG: proline hydroxylase, partial [Mesorhizobium sp.]
MTIHSISAKRASRSAETRVEAQDWPALVSELNAHGCAVMKNLLAPGECDEIAALYPHE